MVILDWTCHVAFIILNWRCYVCVLIGVITLATKHTCTCRWEGYDNHIVCVYMYSMCVSSQKFGKTMNIGGWNELLADTRNKNNKRLLLKLSVMKLWQFLLWRILDSHMLSVNYKSADIWMIQKLKAILSYIVTLILICLVWRYLILQILLVVELQELSKDH